MRKRWASRRLWAAGVMLAILGWMGLFANLRTTSVQAANPAPLAGELLQGRTIVIDPGHGGYDPGALGKHSRESQLNLAMAEQLRQWFKAAGAHVLLTRSGSRDLPPHQKYRVQDRIAWINATRADVLIDIHCNSGGPRWSGPQTFYWDGAASYHLAHDVQQELQYFTGTNRTVTRIDQYVLRYARMPAINVEVGFITNPREESRLMDPGYQKQLTWYIFLGTERWFLKGRWPQGLLETPPPTHMLVR